MENRKTKENMFELVQQEWAQAIKYKHKYRNGQKIKHENA